MPFQRGNPVTGGTLAPGTISWGSMPLPRSSFLM